MMVSYIQSNYSGFGSGVVVPGTGISLQNRGFGFVLTEGHPNQVGPRKRPFQTIIPGFVMQGKEPLMAFGLMGGPMQAQGHLQMMLRMQLWGQDPQTAADAPRWRYVAGLKVAIETRCRTMSRPISPAAAMSSSANRRTPPSASAVRSSCVKSMAAMSPAPTRARMGSRRDFDPR
jgi:gamma-glutamyltranspeptidase